MKIDEGFPSGFIQEVIFKFNDGGSYTLRPNQVGDTIIGDAAHKVMHEMNRWEGGKNSGSVYRVCITDRIEFISRRSETIAAE